MLYNDSIVALATPSGAGAIAVIRGSGNEAITIGNSVFKSIKNKDLLNEINSENWYMTALTGRLLMFPSWLKHNVTPNLTKEYRIALSFNAHFENGKTCEKRK